MQQPSSLIFDKDEIRISTNLTINNQLVPAYKKMYDSKLEKSFLKYFDESDMLAYISITSDMKNILEEYPNLLTKTYGSMAPNFNEEMDIVADIVSVMLDEEAIGELITGDMMVILHDIEEMEMTYKSYEYDEDYNSVEVEKTMTENIPTFSFLLGSKNEELINKIMKLGIKYESI